MTVDKDKLTQPFPKQALKQRQGGGGKALTYVETHTVIHRLNDATSNCWDFKLTRLDQVGDLYVAVGELTIPGLGTRTGIGVQRVLERSGEDLVKGAASDCLKKCATLFGVGLELYGPDYEAGEIAVAPTGRKPELVRPPSLYDRPKATPEQIKTLHWEASQRKLDHDDVHALAGLKGHASIAEMTGDQIKTLKDWIMSANPSEMDILLARAGRPTMDQRAATLGAK